MIDISELIGALLRIIGKDDQEADQEVAWPTVRLPNSLEVVVRQCWANQLRTQLLLAHGGRFFMPKRG